MSTKKISAGDTLTVGDLTDAHVGAFIEVGEPEGILYRLTLGSIDTGYAFTRLVTERGEERRAFTRSTPVKIITPPPVVQPDKPTILGQRIRIEGDDDWRGMVVDLQEGRGLLWDMDGYWRHWDYVLRRAGDRQIIVSDPPRWPDETPDVPERIEVGEWPDDDMHLREWEWIEIDDYIWRWVPQEGGWVRPWIDRDGGYVKPLDGPWTRGERVK
jgi:hypothetical protein